MEIFGMKSLAKIDTHRALIAGLLGLTTLTLAVETQSAEKPNIVFIVADDLGYNELGSYGQEKIQTPRLDELASEGMRFLRAYSGNAVCAPSRCVLMTGKHPGHAEVRNNRSVQPEGQAPISSAAVTLAEVLQAEGYATGAFGKWGLGPTYSEGDPNDQGFDRFFGYNCQAHAHSYYPETLWSDRNLYKLANNPPVPGHASLPEDADPSDPKSYDPFQGDDYAPDHINEQALAFIENNQDRPFFLYYPTIIPHVALHVPDDDLKPYLELGWNDPPFTRAKGYGYTPHFTPRAAYAAMITRLDTYVGRVLDLLKELELEENTIVVFTSDNGTTHLKLEVDYDFFESVSPLRGLKGSLYEGGVRVPLIVRWPGRVEPNSVSNAITGFEDWIPTLHELIDAESELPNDLDGWSLAKEALGQDNTDREFLYREFAGYGGQQAVWMGPWKGIRVNMLRNNNPNPLEIELYNLEDDPSESNNLAEERPEIVQQIAALMEREHEPSTRFPMPPID